MTAVFICVGLTAGLAGSWIASRQRWYALIWWALLGAVACWLAARYAVSGNWLLAAWFAACAAMDAWLWWSSKRGGA